MPRKANRLPCPICRLPAAPHGRRNHLRASHAGLDVHFPSILKAWANQESWSLPVDGGRIDLLSTRNGHADLNALREAYLVAHAAYASALRSELAAVESGTL